VIDTALILRRFETVAPFLTNGNGGRSGSFGSGIRWHRRLSGGKRGLLWAAERHTGRSPGA